MKSGVKNILPFNSFNDALNWANYEIYEHEEKFEKGNEIKKDLPQAIEMA